MAEKQASGAGGAAGADADFSFGAGDDAREPGVVGADPATTAQSAQSAPSPSLPDRSDLARRVAEARASGLVSHSLRDPASAIAAYHDALQLQPADYRSLEAWSETLLMTGPDGFRESLEKALDAVRIAPKRAAANHRACIAHAFDAVESPAVAVSRAVHGLAADPGNAELEACLGELVAEMPRDYTFDPATKMCHRRADPTLETRALASPPCRVWHRFTEANEPPDVEAWVGPLGCNSATATMIRAQLFWRGGLMQARAVTMMSYDQTVRQAVQQHGLAAASSVANERYGLSGVPFAPLSGTMPALDALAEAITINFHSAMMMPPTLPPPLPPAVAAALAAVAPLQDPRSFMGWTSRVVTNDIVSWEQAVGPDALRRWGGIGPHLQSFPVVLNDVTYFFGDVLEITDLVSRADLNGSSCRVVGRNPNGRLRVRVDNSGGTVVALLPSKLRPADASGSGCASWKQAIQDIHARLDSGAGWEDSQGGLRRLVRIAYKGSLVGAFGMFVLGQKETALNLAEYAAKLIYHLDFSASAEFRGARSSPRGACFMPSLMRGAFRLHLEIQQDMQIRHADAKASGDALYVTKDNTCDPFKLALLAFRIIHSVQFQQSTPLGSHFEGPAMATERAMFYRGHLAGAYGLLANWAFHFPEQLVLNQAEGLLKAKGIDRAALRNPLNHFYMIMRLNAENMLATRTEADRAFQEREDVATRWVLESYDLVDPFIALSAEAGNPKSSTNEAGARETTEQEAQEGKKDDGKADDEPCAESEKASDGAAGRVRPLSRVCCHALAAHFYSLAALFEFDDTILKETYLWGVAISMVHTDEDSRRYTSDPTEAEWPRLDQKHKGKWFAFTEGPVFTLGDLRAAVRAAEACHESGLRNTDIFGEPAPDENISYRSTAKGVLAWFAQGESDELPLPHVQRPDSQGIVRCEFQGRTLEFSLNEEMNREKAKLEAKRKTDKPIFDAFKRNYMEKNPPLIGMAGEPHYRVPSLKMLALRSLHGSGLANDIADPGDAAAAIQQCLSMTQQDDDEVSVSQLGADTSTAATTLVDLDRVATALREAKRCAVCGYSGLQVKLKGCSRCHLEFYCSRECQMIAWKAWHKKECAIMREGQ